MSRENPFDWSREELAAYSAHEAVRNGAELGTVLKNLGHYDQGVVDAASARGVRSESPAKTSKTKPRVKRTPRYLIELCGMGDHTYAVVGPAGWAWIHAPWPEAFSKGKSGVSEKIPPEVLQEAGVKAAKPRKADVTVGSCDNDRAIHCSSLYPSFDERPKGRFASTYVGMLY